MNTTDRIIGRLVTRYPRHFYKGNDEVWLRDMTRKFIEVLCMLSEREDDTGRIDLTPKRAIPERKYHVL